MIDLAQRGWWLLGGMVALLMAILVPVAPANASCAASPAPSPHRFTGVVIATRSHDRIATVRTDAGATVEVRGTMTTVDNAASSVDRTYEPGARYEFHPSNDASPFQDSICSVTHLIARGVTPVAQVPSVAAGADTGADGDARRRRSAPWWALGSALVVATVAATGWRRGARSSGGKRTV